MVETHPILVVEDDEDIRDSLLDLFEEHGYAAVGAQHGREALERLSTLETRPCLIVLDLMMPVMDGKAFRDEQLRDPVLATIPVLVISAYQNLDVQAREMKALDCLRKPLDLPKLLRIVKEHCSH